MQLKIIKPHSLYFLLFFVAYSAISLAGISLAGISLASIGHASMVLPVTEEQINKEPWQSYQQLKRFEAKNFSLSATNKHDNNYLLFLLAKAQAENLLYFHDKLNKTVTLAQQLLTKKTALAIVSQLNVYAGINAQRSGFYANAISLLTKAATQATTANLPRIFIMAKNELAYTRSLSESYETSLNDIQKAYVDAFALNDSFLVATINETYGAIYGYLGEYEKSIEYYEKALESYLQLGYKAHVAEAIYGLAATYRYWRKYDLAIANFQKYINKVTYTPNTNIAFFGNYGLAMAFAEKGSCQQALPIINRALKLNGQVDYNAELYKRKASCLIKEKDLSAAKNALDSAKKIFNSIPELNGTSWQLEVEKISASLAHSYGDNNAAYTLLLNYHQQYSTLQAKNSSDRLLKVRTALELERRDIEISLLQQRAKVQALLIDKKSQQADMQRYIIIIVVIFIVAVLAFLLSQQRYTRKLLTMSIQDPLAGVFNRRYIFDFLDRALTRAIPQKQSLAIIVLDIDNFKMANDQYGHPFGDEIIRHVAEICQHNLRNGDVLGRIGGEEFLCVLPRISQDESECIAQRMLASIANHVFLSESGELHSVTVSAGIAHLNAETASSINLYSQADKALYQAKNNGKNKVFTYQHNLKQ
jgi:diguanylate cyclase (GGDEF)-like protein